MMKIKLLLREIYTVRNRRSLIFRSFLLGFDAISICLFAAALVIASIADAFRISKRRALKLT